MSVLAAATLSAWGANMYAMVNSPIGQRERWSRVCLAAGAGGSTCRHGKRQSHLPHDRFWQAVHCSGLWKLVSRNMRRGRRTEGLFRTRAGKASATRLADRGATAHQLMAWFGWTTLREPERYTRAANKKKLARSAGAMLIATGTRIGKP
jgi:hypothetical protein